MTGLISFTTDYGWADGFVAACHGVMARVAPQIRVIDITHDIPAGDVRRAAAVLADTLPYLPPAVHVAVVDPGVGTRRHPVAIRTEGGVLVGPDNGLLSWAAAALGGAREAVILGNEQWFLHPVSRTFHGRDIFAPCAARLAAGAALADAGPALDPAVLVTLPDPVVRTGDGWIEAEVLAVDRFGNVQLAATGADAAALIGPDTPAAATDSLVVGGQPAVAGATFADAGPGGLVVLIDSADKVAVAVNGASAARLLGVQPGDQVRVARRGQY